MATVTNPKPLNSVKIWLMTSKPQCVFLKFNKNLGKGIHEIPQNIHNEHPESRAKKKVMACLLSSSKRPVKHARPKGTNASQ